jgi:hypothetical protein
MRLLSDGPGAGRPANITVRHAYCGDHELSLERKSWFWAGSGENRSLFSSWELFLPGGETFWESIFTDSTLSVMLRESSD